ncbi:MAG: UPF0182 family protein [Candidatus Bathyarchaeia archaeon]
MSSVEKDSRTRPIRWALLTLAVIIIVLVLLLSREIVIFWLNIQEFGDLFIKPLYFGLLGGIVLSAFTFFRVDFKNRRSITWYAINFIVRFIRSGGDMERISPVWIDIESFRMPFIKFLVWQITKSLIGSLFFINVMFGMAVDAIMRGWSSGIEMLPQIFSLPFVTLPIDISYAEARVFPLMPVLTLLIPPLLSSLWLRLVLLVTLTHIIRIIVPFIAAYLWNLERPGLRRFVPTIQMLAAVFILWYTFTRFFISFIDYNTRYLILGLIFTGVALVAFAIIDWRRPEIRFSRREVYLRLLVLAIIGLVTVSAILLNNSIADVRKLDMLGPYVTQLISVNRHLADLESVREAPYEFGSTSIFPDQINAFITQNKELLERVRLWDQQASFDKLRPEIGLIPYINFSDADILRFNGTLYWSASMDLIAPQTVRPEDRWYALHFVYTHVPNGFLMLDAYNGRIVEATRFFPQRRIYYGEGGLFQETWIAYPAGRTSSDEIGGYFYEGRGGVDVPPPLSWIFEPNFMFSYPTTTMHIIRYRDVHERMKLLFPYFKYEIGRQYIDVWPVTDGEQTFWAMPLIIFLNAENVPWSDGNPFGRLVGYALINVYHGDIHLIITGNDFFSQLFKTVYAEYVSTEMPEWLKTQLRYPEELFEWRVSMYNFFHVSEPSTYIAAKEFYKVPEGIDTYYIIAQPHGFKKPEFVGLLSLELRGALGENLAGYIVVRNDYPYTGEMIFYKVPLGAEKKLLGPSAVNEALERNPDFATLKTLLRNPRIGNQIFYRIGSYDVFFIPVYTAPGGGVITQLGTIATVGADFTGEYYVGLGSTVEDSFRAFLARIAGIEVPPTPELSEEERIARLVKIIEEEGFKVLMPENLNPQARFFEGSSKFTSEADWVNVQNLIKEFLETGREYETSRIFIWRSNGKVNIGIMVSIEGIIELHYITIDLG